MSGPICKVCHGTGESHGDGNLDCTACEAATQRVALNAYVASLGPLPAQDIHWLVCQFGMSIVAKAPAVANGASAELPPLPDGLDLDFPSLNPHALGCGIEDRDIHNRYDAAEYGWQEGLDRAIGCIPDPVFDADQMRDYARAAIAASQPNALLVEALKYMCDWLDKLPRRQIKDSQTHSYIAADNVNALVEKASAALAAAGVGE